MFVWLNIGYGSGFDFFEAGEWRRGPVPLAADTRYRPPRAGDILRSDEESVRRAHRRKRSDHQTLSATTAEPTTIATPIHANQARENRAGAMRVSRGLSTRSPTHDTPR